MDMAEARREYLIIAKEQLENQDINYDDPNKENII